MKKTTGMIAAAGFLAGLQILIAQNPPREQNALELGTDLGDREAVIWYLGHCGYAVKTRTKLLIFDYQENVALPDRTPVKRPANPSLSNGWVNPEEIKDLDVVVFASHSHSDHYDRKILDWEKTVPRIRYVFGWQEKEGDNFYSLPAPRKEAKWDGMEIYTVNSHHSGVPESAFLVKTDGLTIFFEGDYIGKMGENAPSNVPDDLRYLKTKYEQVDLLFLGAGMFDPLPEILHFMKPKLLLPMHYGYREGKYAEFASDLGRRGENVPVFLPRKKGDHCRYSRGTPVL